MKTLLLFLSFFLVAQFTTVNAQQTGHSSINIYPIPSYNVPVAALEYAGFEEGYSDFNPNQTEGKRILTIQVHPITNGSSQCDVSAWVFTLDRQIILGPYSLSCYDELSVDIDESAWGALVEADNGVTVDVWIGDGGSSLLKKRVAKHPDSF